MIYLGLIHFNDISDKVSKLSAVLARYTATSPLVVRKNSLILCYAKLSNLQDMDEVWENSSSIVIGRIFDKERGSSFRKGDFINLSSVNKKEVLEKIWGKYIYFDLREKPSQFEVVIDSTGQLPFFYYSFPNGDILFSSDIKLIFEFLSQKPEYNWTYLCSYLIYGNSCAIQTPFKNIEELPPACCLTIKKNSRRIEPFWDPLRVYKRPISQHKDAVDVLEAVLKPWIAPYTNICVSLSGGVDSTSLVYCLKKIKKDDQTLNALNYFHGSVKSSNELIHARKVCQEVGIELIEVNASHSLPFDPVRKKQPLSPNKPFPGLVSLRWTENILDHIPAKGSYTFLSGHGSDNIFMRPPSKNSISDYILEKGLKGSKKQLQSIAQFYRDSLYSLLKKNAMNLGAYFLYQRSDKRTSKNIQHEIPHWIKQDVHQKISVDFVHPIYKHLPSRMLPGKYDQIDALYEGLASIQIEMNHLYTTYYPYLYEPVVEFALSFPTYDLFDQGYDRYPLRKAVCDHFKAETVWRRDKSQTTGVFQLGVKRNLEQVLNICLEGQFVKQGLIEREGLQKTIVLISNGDPKYMWPLIRISSIEIFLKYWEETSLGEGEVLNTSDVNKSCF